MPGPITSAQVIPLLPCPLHLGRIFGPHLDTKALTAFVVKTNPFSSAIVLFVSA